MNLSLDARSQRFLADLDRISTREARVQNRISSGYRVSKPSDDPQQVMDILQLRSSISRADQIGINLSRAGSEANTAEAAVRVAEQLMERAKTVAAQTASGTAENRQGIALEIKEIHEQMVNLTKTSSEGRYIFGGDLDQTALYSTDWTKPGGFVRNAVATNTREIEDVNGSRFSVSLSASQLFDTRKPDDSFADDNVLNALYSLEKSLENDDATGAQNAIVLIDKSIEHLGRSLTYYGQVQNRLANATTLNQSALVARKTELSQAQDTDMPTALVEMQQVQVHHQAALGAQAQQQRKSLFDYLA